VLSLLILGILTYFFQMERASIPAHLLNHTVVFEKSLIDPEKEKKLNELIKEMGSDKIGFPSNVSADVKTGVKGKIEHVGEARPVLEDGSCDHQYLTPDLSG
jgi:hypothetical protein